VTARAGDALIILQARMGSTRRPGKILAQIDGQTLLSHCVRRLQASAVGPVVVATTTLPDDDATVVEATRLDAIVVRGPVEDVLERFRLAAAEWAGAWVIRATADNPAVDHEAPRRVLEYLTRGADYVVETGLPVGAAVEGLRTGVLRAAAAEAHEACDREHVTPWVKAHGERFALRYPEAPAGLRRPDLKLTVDTPDDLAFLGRVLTQTRGGSRVAPLAEIIAAADWVLARGHT